MDAGDLTGELMFVDDQAAVGIDDVDPPVSRCRVDHSVHFVQVKADDVLGMGVDHLGHLVVYVPGLLDELEELDAAVR